MSAPRSAFRLSYRECDTLLRARLGEPAPGRIQLVSGPRQVGKTTLLLALAAELGPVAIYAACDSPEATLPGFWDRLWHQAEATAAERGRAVVLLDEAHLLPNWAARLKGEWDRLRRRALAVHVVATGSSALRLAGGSRESLAGRFERLTLTHWPAASVAEVFGIPPRDAVDLVVRMGSYPGALPLREDRARWTAYVREAIVEPAIGRDLLALGPVRKPALLRQVFGVCVASPAQVVSLQKIQGQLVERGALETIAHYLALLEEAFLVAALPKHARRALRRRAAPPKLVVLNQALLAATDPEGAPEPARAPARFGGRERMPGPRLECRPARGLLAGGAPRGRRHPRWDVGALGRGDQDRGGRDDRPARAPGVHPPLPRVSAAPLDPPGQLAAERAGIASVSWHDFLLSGPPRRA